MIRSLRRFSGSLLTGPPTRNAGGEREDGKRVRSQGRATRRAGPPDNKGKKTKNRARVSRSRRDSLAEAGVVPGRKGWPDSEVPLFGLRSGMAIVSTHAWNSGGQ